MLLTHQQIQTLLAGKPITEASPWVENNRDEVAHFYHVLIEEICSVTSCMSRVEWDDYGSGYASYIDAWFYRPDEEFSPNIVVKFGSGFKGLIVLLSRLSPYYVFMEGEKHWDAKGSSSYLPDSSMVDDLQCVGVKALSIQVQAILDAAGLVRLSKSEVSSPMPKNSTVSTNLAGPEFSEFDAIFHWED